MHQMIINRGTKFNLVQLNCNQKINHRLLLRAAARWISQILNLRNL